MQKAVNLHKEAVCTILILNCKAWVSHSGVEDGI
jgi:hypothetical protein